MNKQSYAAKWRWAKTICNNKLCSIKQKHVRGYKKCVSNPDLDLFGFNKKNGK